MNGHPGVQWRQLPQSGAWIQYRYGRPVALVVGREVLAIEQLDDLEAACTRISTLPDLRPAIAEFRDVMAPVRAEVSR